MKEKRFLIKIISSGNLICVERVGFESEIFVPQIFHGRIALLNVSKQNRCCSKAQENYSDFSIQIFNKKKQHVLRTEITSNNNCHHKLKNLKLGSLSNGLDKRESSVPKICQPSKKQNFKHSPQVYDSFDPPLLHNSITNKSSFDELHQDNFSFDTIPIIRAAGDADHYVVSFQSELSKNNENLLPSPLPQLFDVIDRTFLSSPIVLNEIHNETGDIYGRQVTPVLFPDESLNDLSTNSLQKLLPENVNFTKLPKSLTIAKINKKLTSHACTKNKSTAPEVESYDVSFGTSNCVITSTPCNAGFLKEFDSEESFQTQNNLEDCWIKCLTPIRTYSKYEYAPVMQNEIPSSSASQRMKQSSKTMHSDFLKNLSRNKGDLKFRRKKGKLVIDQKTKINAEQYKQQLKDISIGNVHDLKLPSTKNQLDVIRWTCYDFFTNPGRNIKSMSEKLISLHKLHCVQRKLRTDRKYKLLGTIHDVINKPKEIKGNFKPRKLRI